VYGIIIFFWIFSYDNAISGLSNFYAYFVKIVVFTNTSLFVVCYLSIIIATTRVDPRVWALVNVFLIFNINTNRFDNLIAEAFTLWVILNVCVLIDLTWLTVFCRIDIACFLFPNLKVETWARIFKVPVCLFVTYTLAAWLVLDTKIFIDIVSIFIWHPADMQAAGIRATNGHWLLVKMHRRKVIFRISVIIITDCRLKTIIITSWFDVWSVIWVSHD